MVKDSLPRCSPTSVSGSNLLHHWRATYILDGFQPFLWNFVSDSDLNKVQKHWRKTYLLDACLPQAILVSGSDLVKHWRGTHSLDVCSPHFVSKSDPVHPVNTGENSQAGYMSQFTLSHQWYWSSDSGQTLRLESDSQTGCVFTTSHQWFWSSQTLEVWLTNWMGVYPFSLVVLIQTDTRMRLVSQTGWVFIHSHQFWVWFCQTLDSESNSHSGWVFSHSCQWFWSCQTLLHWRATHILDGCSPIPVNGSDLVKPQRVTHILDGSHSSYCQWFLSSHTASREQLTS